VDGVREAWEFALALLNNAESDDREVHSDDTAADRLPLALACSAWSVAGVAFGEEQSHTGWVHNTLLHWEALFIVAAGDLEDVALEFVADTVARHFGAHSSIHEDTELALIFDLDQLLRAIRRERYVKLHLDGVQSRKKRCVVGAVRGRRTVVVLQEVEVGQNSLVVCAALAT
jgi:hypothetical protein